MFAPALEREAIYNAIRQRRCYATLGGRPILRFTINGAFMGESLRLARADTVKHIVCDVAGTADLARVEVIKNGEPFFQFVTTDTGAHNRTLDYREEFPDTAPSQARRLLLPARAAIRRRARLVQPDLDRPVEWTSLRTLQ